MKKKLKVILSVALVAAFLIPAVKQNIRNTNQYNHMNTICTVDPPSVRV